MHKFGLKEEMLEVLLTLVAIVEVKRAELSTEATISSSCDKNM